jgi:hypothetical protein
MSPPSRDDEDVDALTCAGVMARRGMSVSFNGGVAAMASSDFFKPDVSWDSLPFSFFFFPRGERG